MTHNTTGHYTTHYMDGHFCFLSAITSLISYPQKTKLVLTHLELVLASFLCLISPRLTFWGE